jgi:hypothetical protein
MELTPPLVIIRHQRRDPLPSFDDLRTTQKLNIRVRYQEIDEHVLYVCGRSKEILKHLSSEKEM